MLGRYQLPAPRYPECLLARHELGLFEECREILRDIGAQNRRGPAFNRLLLPRCQPLVEAIGHRMAYEAALETGVDRRLLDMYEAGIVKLDGAWYAEHAGLGSKAQFEMEERAATATAPYIEHYLDELRAEPYVFAAILTKERWESHIRGLECMTGGATLSIIPDKASDREASPLVAARL